MAPVPPPTMTPVLGLSIELRIKELEHTKEAFKRRYHLNTNLAAETSTIKRIPKLIENVENDPDLKDEDVDVLLDSLKRYMDQAQDDRSMSESTLIKLEKQIWNKLDKHLNRMEVSCLHADLIKEALEAKDPVEVAATHLEAVSLEDEFEIVENTSEEALKAFEKAISTPRDVDTEAIGAYLSSLFESEEDNQLLQNLKSGMQEYGDELTGSQSEVDKDLLMWTMTNLLKNDSIDPAKQEILKECLQTPLALEELIATLEMKTFRHWNYKDADTGLSATLRQGIGGEQCIVIEEDVIDMLFLHYTATGWTLKLKELSADFLDKYNLVVPNSPSELDKLKRSYFLEPSPPAPPEFQRGTCAMCQNYPVTAQHFINTCCGPPLPPPPPPPLPATGCRKGRKARDFYHNLMPPPPPPPPSLFCYDTMRIQRKEDYKREFFMSRLPTKKWDGKLRVSRPEDAQAKLIKTLASEAKLREAFDGNVHARTTQFKSLVSSLPHKTIIAVLRFLGVPEVFLGFFTRFLKTKIKLGLPVEGLSAKIRERQCGIPDNHGLERFFTEVVMFFLELTVHKMTGSYLYRLHDRCYFVGTLEQCQAADKEVARFADVMGLDIHDIRSPGKISIGFLTMDTQLPSGPGKSVCFAIDNDQVVAYAHRMKKQLDACTTILGWISLWNKTVGTYAAHLFGPLAEVFGESHLKTVKVAYTKILSIIFDGSDPVSHVKRLLNNRIQRAQYDTHLALEPIICLLQAYGGLGVKNPFITFSLARKIRPDPAIEIQKYLKDEEAYYNAAVERYSSLTPEEHQQRFENVSNGSRLQKPITVFIPSNTNQLASSFTKAEMVAHRESLRYESFSHEYHYCPKPVPSVVSLYQTLLGEPIDHINMSEKVTQELDKLSGTGDMKASYQLSGEDQWMLHMYSDECFERYGTLEIWWAAGVPTRVYKMLRGHGYEETDETH